MAEQQVHQHGMVIKAVTLYDNGYAVFEREATIQGHGSIDLFFSSAHMESVLETIQFLGEGEKKVDNIAYEATKPRATIDLQGTNPLVNLLKSLMGRVISFQFTGKSGELENAQGKILGIDEMMSGSHDKKVFHVSILAEGTRIKTVPIEAVRSFDIMDTQVHEDLAFSLDLKRNSNADDLQKLSVFYSDIGSPLLLKARYGFQVREWKSSYRMKLSVHPTVFHLDGLAIVENSLDEDWNDVILTLVVGAPTVESSSRSVADEGLWQLNVKSLSGSYVTVRANPKDSVISIKHKLAKKLRIPFMSFNLMFAGKAIEEGRMLSDYSVGNNATLHMSAIASRKRKFEEDISVQKFVMAAQDNLSYYRIPMHVTAKRKQKAIVPLLQVELDGQKVVLYDETIRKGNPLQALLFENVTGRTLEGGSMTISTDAVLLGQSNLPTLHPGDESPPIPYAVELDCEVVKITNSSYLTPHQVTVQDGIVKIVRIHQEVTIYKIKNKGKNQLDFLLNHLFLEDYDLVQKLNAEEEEEPVDITDRFYQFRFIVPPNTEKKTFVIREEVNDLKEHVIQHDVDNDKLSEWVDKSLISGQVEQEIKAIFLLKKDISKLERGIYDKEVEIREITSTQERLQQIISKLEGHEKEASKYVKSLSDKEDYLTSLQTQIKSDRLKKKAHEKNLVGKAEAISFSKTFPRSDMGEDADRETD